MTGKAAAVVYHFVVPWGAGEKDCAGKTKGKSEVRFK